MRRSLTPEVMDDPDASREDLALLIHWLGVHHRWLGTRGALLRNLQRWSHRWPRNEPVTLLDVGCGGADLAAYACRWGRARGFDLRVTAIDHHPTTAALARERFPDEPGLTILDGDALTIRDWFGTQSFDYVHATFFLHHLSEIRCLTLLAGVEQVARRGVVITDLVRSRAMLTLGGLVTRFTHATVWTDTLAGVRAGFTRAEAMDLAARVDLGFLRYRRSRLLYRFTLAGERPGAWG